MKFIQNEKAFYRALTITVIVSLFTLAIHHAGWLERAEWMSVDWRMAEVRKDSTASPEVAVVLIDDTTLKAMEPVAGRFPWPRWVYADLLDFFARGNPKAVLFDILFTEKQISGDDDERLVSATIDSPFVYHASRFVLDSADELNQNLLNQPIPPDFAEKFDLRSRLNLANGIEFNNAQIPSNNRYYLPFEDLYLAAPGVGAVDVSADRDGIYRHVRPIQRYKDAYIPALSTAAYFDDKQPKTIQLRRNALVVDDTTIPLDRDGRYLVNYYKNYSVYSLSGIMASLQMIYAGQLDNLLVNPQEFENKIVFIGASAAGLEDLKNTPFDENLPGVLIHASVASNMIDRDFVHYSSPVLTTLLVVIFTAVIAFTTLLSKKTLIQNSIPLLIGGSYLLFCFYALTRNELYNLSAPLLAVTLSWLSAFSSLLIFEGREKRRFKRMMSQYLSPAVLSTVVSNHEDFAKAEVGTKENVTVLFSDIRGFTILSEHFPAEIVVEILNRYFSHMTDAIFSTQGTIDKFIGDAIMAFWGAPVKSSTHAKDGTRAALEMLEKLKVVQQWLQEKSYPSISIGVGLHTGDVILGNIGSEQKLDYTIIGDNVNLASRVEGLTKKYGCEILITESTYAQLENTIPCRKIDVVRVKGKQKPIGIYQPLVNPDLVTSQQLSIAQQLADQYQDAFACYLNRQWNKVETILSASAGTDAPSRMLLERVHIYKDQPPPEDWDGVYTMTSK